MKYTYNGPVSDGRKELARCWHAETRAPTIEKAIVNFKYQFNTQNNRRPYCTVEFNIKNIKGE